MIHLFGAVDDPAGSMAVVPGLAILATGELSYAGATVVSAPQPDEASLREHDSVVRRLTEVGSVVPFRFGTVVSGEDDLQLKVGTYASAISALLVWLRGRLEMAVRAHVPQQMSPVETGRDYLARLRPPTQMERIHRDLSESSVASNVDWDPTRGLMKAAYLVDRADVAGFRGRVEELASREVGLSLTGPWAPYSFVDVGDRRGGVFD